MKNSRSIQLVEDFINDYLQGNINQMITFDLMQLKGDHKYGACHGGSFDCDNTNLTRSVLSVVFEDAWPNFDEDTMEQGLYRGDIINTFNTMFGPKNKDGVFSGLNKFKPSKQLQERVSKFYSLYHTIGNIVPLPNKYVARKSLNTFRGTYARWRDFFDHFLQSIETYLDDGNTGIELFDHLMLSNQDSFSTYMQPGGFQQLCKNLLLEDYLNEHGVKIMFDVLYWWKSGLSSEKYFAAVNKYLDFCEPFIIKRGQIINDMLKTKMNL